MLASRMVRALQRKLEDLLRHGRSLFRSCEVLAVHQRFETVTQRPAPDGNVAIVSALRTGWVCRGESVLHCGRHEARHMCTHAKA